MTKRDFICEPEAAGARKLHKMNANELRDYAVLLGADRKTLYGTSRDALRLIVQRLEKGGRA